MTYSFKIQIALTVFLVAAPALGEFSDSPEKYRLWAANDVAPVTSDLYRDECGDCHAAFPPGLLPQRSWRKLFETQDNHFGDDLALDEDTVSELLNYAVHNAADDSRFHRSKSIMRSIELHETPLRITEVPHIMLKHKSIPRKLLENIGLKGISNCDACHVRVEEGSFDPREIKKVWALPERPGKRDAHKAR